MTKRRRATDPHPTRTSRPGVHTRPDPYPHHTGRWERRHQVTRREDLASDPKYTDERHGFFNRWQKRAGFGDGGKGVAEWTQANLDNMSLMHSGRWQRRSGARLATEFMPARAYAGYGRNRGEFVPFDPKEYPTLEREMEEERSRNADLDFTSPYVENDPNFMNPRELELDRAARIDEYTRELSALECRRGLNATTRVHSDSRLPNKTGKPRADADTPCWADPVQRERETAWERWGPRARDGVSEGGERTTGEGAPAANVDEKSFAEENVPPMCGHHSRWKPELGRVEQHELFVAKPLRATGADVAKGEMYGREVDPVKVPNKKEALAEVGRHEVRLDENFPGRDPLRLPPLNIHQRLGKKATIAREHMADRHVPCGTCGVERPREVKFRESRVKPGRRVCNGCFQKEEFKAARSKKIQHQKAQVRAYKGKWW